MEACKLPVFPAVKLNTDIVKVKCLIGTVMHLGLNNAAVAIYALLLSKLATAALYKLA